MHRAYGCRILGGLGFTKHSGDSGLYETMCDKRRGLRRSLWGFRVFRVEDSRMLNPAPSCPSCENHSP